MDKKELISKLDNELKKMGFEKKSTTWYLDEAEVIKVVNLQKSNYSDIYHVNIGIFLKAFGQEKYPKEDQCHIRTRLDDSMVKAPKDYSYLFDLEKVNLDKELYRKEIEKCVQKNIIPQLELIKSKEGLLKIAQKNPAILNMLPLKVKEYLAFDDTNGVSRK